MTQRKAATDHRSINTIPSFTQSSLQLKLSLLLSQMQHVIDFRQACFVHQENTEVILFKDLSSSLNHMTQSTGPVLDHMRWSFSYWPADTRSVSELMCSCSQNKRNLSSWFNIEMTTPTEAAVFGDEKDVFTQLLAGVSKSFDLPTGPVGWRLTEWRPEQFALQLKSELRSADVCGELICYHSPMTSKNNTINNDENTKFLCYHFLNKIKMKRDKQVKHFKSESKAFLMAVSSWLQRQQYICCVSGLKSLQLQKFAVGKNDLCVVLCLVSRCDKPWVKLTSECPFNDQVLCAERPQF